MTLLLSQEETEKIADQSVIELLPLGKDEKPTKKSTSGSVGAYDDVDAGPKAGGAKGKTRPEIPLIQVCILIRFIKPSIMN